MLCCNGFVIVMYWLKDNVIVCKMEEIKNREFMVLMVWIVMEENVKIY